MREELTYEPHPGTSLSTTDLDGLVRGDLDRFLDALDDVVQTPWGPFELLRGPVEEIAVSNRSVQPRRFDVNHWIRQIMS